MSAMTTARKNASGGQPFSERWTFAGEGQALTYVPLSRGVVQSVTSQLSHGSEETEAPGSKMKEARVLSYDCSISVKQTLNASLCTMEQIRSSTHFSVLAYAMDDHPPFDMARTIVPEILISLRIAMPFK